VIIVYDSQGRPKTSATGEDEFINLVDTPESYAGDGGKVIAVKDTEDGVEFVVQSGAGVVDEFTELIDTPSSYTGHLGEALVVASGETNLEFTEVGTGDMTKVVYDTNDDGIVNEADVVTWSGVTGKPATYPPDSHDHDERYYTETEVNTKLALQDEFTELTDTPSSYTDQAGKYTIVNETEDGLEFAVGTGSGGGASDLLALDDTPVTYSGASGKSLVVNNEEDGVEFITVSGGGSTGTIYSDFGISMDVNTGDFATLGGSFNEVKRANFFIPEDFSSLLSAVVIIIGLSTHTNTFNINVDYGSNGEAYNTHSDGTTTGNISVITSQITEIDFSGLLSSISIGDYVGVAIDKNVNSTLHYLGLKITYTKG